MKFFPHNPSEDIDTTCRLPKHKGKLWVDIVMEDRGYIEWVVSGEGPIIDSDLYDYLMDLLENMEEEEE